MRYKVTGTWYEVARFDNFLVEEADIVDTKTNTPYQGGARRVVNIETGKPVKGKGGTTPYFGEMAWADSERLAGDLASAARWA